MGGYRYYSYISYFLLFTITKYQRYIANSEIICKCRKSSRRLRYARMGITRLKTKQKTAQAYGLTRKNKTKNNL